MKSAILELNKLADRIQEVVPAGESISRAEVLAMINSQIVDISWAYWGKHVNS